MAQSLQQILVKCENLSTSEIEARIVLAESNPATSKETLENYKQVLLSRRVSNISSPEENDKTVEVQIKSSKQSEAELEIAIGEYWVHLRKSALKRDKEFNLTFADVKKLVTRKTCYYTGKRLDAHRTTERLDSSKGYVKGNVVAVCSEANQLKNMIFENQNSTMRMSLSDLKAFVISMENLEEIL